MLFNSPEFLLLFLPIVVAGYLVLNRIGTFHIRAGWLILASLFFYGWWEPIYLFLISASIMFNYLMARLISARPHPGRLAKPLLVFGVGANLATLGFFKYANFFINTVADVSGTSFNSLTIILPLAISFYTFQQIAFLVDVYRDKANETDFLSYCLFVTFFPQLIAGPIVHHGEMMGQFKHPAVRGGELWDNLAVGLTIITMGLFKKVILADKMAFWSDRVFDTVQMGGTVSFVEAWVGVISFTLQIYFDFSGYSDMAIGLARLFGIRLPLNFSSPYKALNIVDFWRRWHITLSRFLRDYLYYPLGGNRKGRARRYANLIIVMGLGGLWHGAGWTFVIWGLMHGAYLALNHMWWTIRKRVFQSTITNGGLRFVANSFAGVLTFSAVTLAWAMFRAQTFGDAVTIYREMFAFNNIVLPAHYQAAMGDLGDLAAQAGINFGAVPLYGGGMQIVWMIVTLALVWFFPNTQELMSKWKPVIDYDPDQSARVFGVPIISWRPSLKIGVVSAGVSIFLVIKLLQGQSGEFIYFQF